MYICRVRNILEQGKCLYSLTLLWLRGLQWIALLSLSTIRLSFSKASPEGNRRCWMLCSWPHTGGFFSHKGYMKFCTIPLARNTRSSDISACLHLTSLPGHFPQINPIMYHKTIIEESMSWWGGALQRKNNSRANVTVTLNTGRCVTKPKFYGCHW